MEYEMKNLIIRGKEGDQEAKEKLLKNLTPLIKASIKKYYFGEEVQEDLIQEGYLKILIELERFQLGLGVPFLGYIKLHLKYFYMEKGKKHRALLSLNHTTEGVEFLELLLDEGMSIEEQLEQQEAFAVLGQALDNLTEKQRKLIEMHFLQGYSLRRIADSLDLHYQTIVKTKDLAMKRLRKFIGANSVRLNQIS